MIEKKAAAIKKKFLSFKTTEEKYNFILKLGESLSKLDDKKFSQEHLVNGCQSKVFIKCFLRNGKMFFEAGSDSLISSGLASLLISIYNNETPEDILKQNPLTLLKDIDLGTLLSPTRANGLNAIYIHIKKEVLQHLLKK